MKCCCYCSYYIFDLNNQFISLLFSKPHTKDPTYKVQSLANATLAAILAAITTTRAAVFAANEHPRHFSSKTVSARFFVVIILCCIRTAETSVAKSLTKPLPCLTRSTTDRAPRAITDRICRRWSCGTTKVRWRLG